MRKKFRNKNQNSNNLIKIKPSNKILQATKLPKLLNLNPRSIYNKVEEFKSFVLEEEIDLVCLSESWERPDQSLEEIIDIENYKVIANVHQRHGMGGRPAVIVNKNKYVAEDLTNTLINIPWGVEVVWALLTPKEIDSTSKVQKIAVASIYSRTGSKKKSLLLDHIAQVYGLLSAKYERGLHWILCGDTNDLKIEPILHMNLNLKQVVKDPTRLNPPKILDPIITTLADFYQKPECLAPLQADENTNGVASDHKMVVMEPLKHYSGNLIRTYKQIKYRPMSDIGMHKMRLWLEKQEWSEITHEESSNKKAEMFQLLLCSKYEEFFPEKVCKIASDSQPFYNSKLQALKRKKNREYHKNRRSKKWRKLNNVYESALKEAKHSFYRNKIMKLKKADPRKWYSELKKITRIDQHEAEEISVEDIKELPVEEQVEMIADKFAEVSNEYDKLNNDDIIFPDFDPKDSPQFTELEVLNALKSLNTRKSSVKGDVPSFIYKQFAEFLKKPVTNVINASILQGNWPDICKMEIVTPIPKEYPTKTIDQLRNISGLSNLNKIFEKLIVKLVVQDMKEQLDPSQFANQKGLSIQHYLVKFLDRILSSLDRANSSETCAVIATLVDWKQAFPRQCPKLGIQSFIDNGVRPALIPLIASFFQNRKMRVKWHGKLSKIRELNGGGPQGSSFGIWEYLSQSNDNAEFVDIDDRFKFVDDLTFIEIVYLVNIGLASHNSRLNVPSDVAVHNQIIPSVHLKTQEHLKTLNEWTVSKK